MTSDVIACIPFSHTWTRFTLNECEKSGPQTQKIGRLRLAAALRLALRGTSHNRECVAKRAAVDHESRSGIQIDCVGGNTSAESTVVRQ